MKNSAHLLSPQIGNAGDPHAPLFAASTTCEISCVTISGMPLSPSRYGPGPQSVTLRLSWIRSELPERLLGVPPGLVQVRQQPTRGIIVHVRIEVDRDVAGRSGQVEQLVVLEPMLPPRLRRTAVHAS